MYFIFLEQKNTHNISGTTLDSTCNKLIDIISIKEFEESIINNSNNSSNVRALILPEQNYSDLSNFINLDLSNLIKLN